MTVAQFTSAIYIDADGCPVKDEIYKVAARYSLPVFVVANKPLNVPLSERIKMIVAPGSFDAADDWIAAHIQAFDICVTTDIPLADRCLKRDAFVITPKGDEFTKDSIGDAMATRELMQRLREMGEMRGGPPPFEKKDRSKFLSKLDQIVQASKRAKTSP